MRREAETLPDGCQLVLGSAVSKALSVGDAELGGEAADTLETGEPLARALSVDTLEGVDALKEDGKAVKLCDSDPEFVTLVDDDPDSEALPVTLTVSVGLP